MRNHWALELIRYYIQSTDWRRPLSGAVKQHLTSCRLEDRSLVTGRCRDFRVRRHLQTDLRPCSDL